MAHPAQVVAFTELDEAFFRAGEELSATHEAEPDAPEPSHWRRWLFVGSLVPVAVLAAFVVV